MVSSDFLKCGDKVFLHCITKTINLYNHDYKTKTK